MKASSSSSSPTAELITEIKKDSSQTISITEEETKQVIQVPHGISVPNPNEGASAVFIQQDVAEETKTPSSL